MNRRDFIKVVTFGSLTFYLTGCGNRSLVERSEFGDMAFKIGAAL